MSKKPPANKPMKDINWLVVFHEIDNSTDRVTAIVAAAFVENNLAIAIQSRLVPMSDARMRELFEGNNPVMASFHAKSQIGLALGLYGPKVGADIDKVRQIRNEFAHRLDIRSFDDPDVATKCDQLNAPKHLAMASGKPLVADRRSRFIATATHLVARFDLVAQSPMPPKRAPASIDEDY